MNIATRCARANHQKNSGGALREGLDWIYARDGALTARDRDENWITGCSLPRRAAMAQLRKLEVAGPVACFLAPPHAAAVRVAMKKLRPQQACVVIVPDQRDMEIIFACEDFSEDVLKDRVFFVAGESWPKQLRDLFDRQPGLPIPTQFIRLPSSPSELIDELIGSAQQVFSQITASRAQAIQSLRSTWVRPNANRFCIVAPTHERLWNNWGRLLVDCTSDLENRVTLDPDRSTQASPLAVSQVCTECDAIVTVDLARGDAPNVVHDDMPWFTWCVSGKIPVRSTSGARDRLLLLDPFDLESAILLGWNRRELQIAQPICQPTTGGDGIAIVAECAALDPPANIDDFSSHRILWNSIVDELLRNPFAIGNDPQAYLDSRVRKLEIDSSTLNVARLMSMLITPAYQEGLRRVLVETGIKFSQDISAGALVHAWPDQRRVHAVDFSGRAVIRPGTSRQNFLQQVHAALAGRLKAPTPAKSTICGAVLCEMLREI